MTAEFDCIDQVERIDWNAQWSAGLHAIAAPILAAADWRAALNDAAQRQALCNHAGLPIRFVPHQNLPTGTAYEAFISVSGGVPTRANLHDFFNALTWLAYPQIKKRLNALQAAELMRPAAAPANGSPSKSTRGKLRDAATLFDENAALFSTADEELAAALRAHDWQTLFITRRMAFQHRCSVHLFGHALMEKLIAPYKAITAHAWIATVEPEFFGCPEIERRMQLDQLVGKQLEQGLTTADFSPLPVLGVPGWRLQQDGDFYADGAVFRPKRENTHGAVG